MSLSPDAILEYHILPNRSLTHEPLASQIYLAATMVITLLGLVNSVLSIITFARSSMLNIGCEVYLLLSSIASLITIVMFTVKFWLLLFAQMSVIANCSFLQFDSTTTDYLFPVFILSLLFGLMAVWLLSERSQLAKVPLSTRTKVNELQNGLLHA